MPESIGQRHRQPGGFHRRRGGLSIVRHSDGLLQDRREGVWIHYRLAEDMTPELRALVKSMGSMLDPAAVGDLKARLDTSLCASPDD